MSAVFTQYEGSYALFSSGELAEGEKVTATTVSGHEVDVIVGKILDVSEEGTYALFERAAEERDPSIATFAKREGEWVVRGQDLFVGDVVTVEQKNKTQVEVIITELLEEDEGYTYARFERSEPEYEAPYFHRLNDTTWVVRGRDLKEGQTITVATKAKGEREVRITGIIGTSETGLMDAFFE